MTTATIPTSGNEFAYRLCVLTHAAAAVTLAPTLEAFEAHSSPAPAEVLVVVDGPEFGYVSEALDGRFPDARVTIHTCPVQQGFCAATNRAWVHAAGGPGPLYVVYLEGDFVLTRDVDWRDLAAVLDANPQLAQMALVRNAVNDGEIRAGGLVESRPGQFHERETPSWKTVGTAPYEMAAPPHRWLEEREFFTTNPSIMRRSFMQENPWVYDGRPFCEGRYGIGLREEGFSFGFWGCGEVWCEHVGVRSGTGY